MRKVIEPGKQEFIGVCSKCGCKFSYELADIFAGGVYCPECGGYVVHPKQNTTIYDSMTVEDFNRLHSNYCSSQTHYCAACKYIAYTASNRTAIEPVAWCTLHQKEVSEFSLGCMSYKDVNG